MSFSPAVLKDINKSDGIGLFPPIVDGRFWNQVGEGLVQPQTAVLHQHHDADRGEALADRSGTKHRLVGDRFPGGPVYDAILALEDDLPVLDHDEGRAWNLGPGEDATHLAVDGGQGGGHRCLTRRTRSGHQHHRQGKPDGQVIPKCHVTSPIRHGETPARPEKCCIA